MRLFQHVDILKPILQGNGAPSALAHVEHALEDAKD